MSLRGLKRRVERLEEIYGRKKGGATILVNPGETREQALERHFREHPNDDPESKFNIILDFSEGEEPENLGGEKHLDRGRPEAREKSAGRTWGDGSDLLQPVQIDDRDAEGESPWPWRLDKNLPYDSWDGLLCQKGVWFRRDTLEPIHPEAPLPVQPEKLDIQKRRMLIRWKGEDCYIQEGWLFSSSTHKAINF